MIKSRNLDPSAVRIVAYLDSLQAKVNALPARFSGRLQSTNSEELSVLMASILDTAFKGEL